MVQAGTAGSQLCIDESNELLMSSFPDVRGGKEPSLPKPAQKKSKTKGDDEGGSLAPPSTETKNV